MTRSDVARLVDWLGPEGAMAGLEKSKLTNAELMVLARECGQTLEKKAPRRQIAIEIAMSQVQRIDKPVEYMLSMSVDELQRYFSEAMVSEKELRSLLMEMGIAPTGRIKGKLLDYAAREIHELGVFQRVAKGSGSK